MIEHIVFFTILLFAAWVFANVEIQIEGSGGWAANLPTWKIDNKWTKLFFSGRPLTGYHFYIILFIFVLAHMPVAVGLSHMTFQLEMRILSFFLFFWIFEDFIWFVINPAFGLKNFKAHKIWWHAPNWWWIMPREYWIFFPAAAALYYYSWCF